LNQGRYTLAGGEADMRRVRPFNAYREVNFGTGVPSLRGLVLRLVEPLWNFYVGQVDTYALREAGVTKKIINQINTQRRLAGVVCAASAILFGGVGAAHSGPCTTQIVALEQQINTASPGPESGPSAPQTLGAQLHHQPTPGSVDRGEHIANKDGDVALDRARKADERGDAKICNDALDEARRLYGVD
jgi:hypothetical protein